MTAIESTGPNQLEQAKTLRKQAVRDDLRQTDDRRKEAAVKARETGDAEKSVENDSIAKKEARESRVADDNRIADRIEQADRDRGARVDISV